MQLSVHGKCFLIVIFYPITKHFSVSKSEETTRSHPEHGRKDSFQRKYSWLAWKSKINNFDFLRNLRILHLYSSYFAYNWSIGGPPPGKIARCRVLILLRDEIKKRFHLFFYGKSLYDINFRYFSSSISSELCYIYKNDSIIDVIDESISSDNSKLCRLS